jgi:hypothetical protein
MIRRYESVMLLTFTALLSTLAWAQEAAATDERTEADQPAQLDLRIPDIRTLYTQEQIDALLASTYQEERTEEVEVRGRREVVTPRVWPGIAAPIWAIFNPTQAWRIFAPLPPDQTRTAALRSDATTPYQRPASITAADL